jgi:transcriptional regulator with XRE-family HTH domain
MEAMVEPGPTVQRRRLRIELRLARLQAELTLQKVSDAMDWSLSKLIRIEDGSVSISTNDLRAILQYYDVADEGRVEELVALSRAARKRSPWNSYATVASRQLIELIEYESAAQTTRNFQPLVVPGMLQTTGYMRASTTQLEPGKPQHEVDSVVELRTKRQELLRRPNPPAMFFVLDEAVVRRVVGGREVMLGQLRRLIDVSGSPNVTIEVVPFGAGLWPGMQQPFVIHGFSEAPDDYVLDLESPRGDQFPDEISNFDEIARFLNAFEHLRETSLGPERTIAFLHDLIDQLA